MWVNEELVGERVLVLDFVVGLVGAIPCVDRGKAPGNVRQAAAANIANPCEFATNLAPPSVMTVEIDDIDPLNNLIAIRSESVACRTRA